METCPLTLWKVVAHILILTRRHKILLNPEIIHFKWLNFFQCCSLSLLAKDLTLLSSVCMHKYSFSISSSAATLFELASVTSKLSDTRRTQLGHGLSSRPILVTAFSSNVREYRHDSKLQPPLHVVVMHPILHNFRFHNYIRTTISMQFWGSENEMKL